jgi:hypothetical protein
MIVRHGRWLVLSVKIFHFLRAGLACELCRDVGQTLILNSSLVQCRGGGSEARRVARCVMRT